MEIERKELEDAIVAMANIFDQELFALSESELANQWHFKWDANRSVAGNLYNFFDMLELYQKRCRRWEEHHNGCCCVVERVRDKYLMPRIRDFEAELRRAVAESEVKG